MGYITLLETGQQWADWPSVLATSTGISTGGINGKDLSALSSVTLVQTGDVLGSSSIMNFTKAAGAPFTIRAAGFDRAADLAAFKPFVLKSTSTRPKVDCNGADAGIHVGSMGNVTVQGLQITNGNVNSASAGMLRGIGSVGAAMIEFCDFSKGAIAVRWTGGVSDVTLQYNNVYGHGYGCFRIGAGQSGFVTDVGNILVQYNNIRWNRGYMTTAQQIASAQVFDPTYDYVATDPSQAIAAHGCLVLKNALSINVLSNYIDGAGQFGVVFENTPTGNILNNRFSNISIGTASGGLFSITPNSGVAPAINIRGNLVTDLVGNFIYSVGSGLLDVQENTVFDMRQVKDSGGTIIVAGGIKNMIGMTNQGSLRHFNNLYVSSPANNSAYIGFGATGITSFVSDYNSYDRQGNLSHQYVSGSVNGSSVAASSAAILQAQNQSAFDSNFPLRDSHSKFSGGTLTAVTNPEIVRGATRKLPAPASATSVAASVTYPVFSPYACTISLVDANGATVTGIPAGAVAANSTTNITVNGLAGQVPTIQFSA